MNEKKVKVAVIGLGTVGTGVARLLLERGDELAQKTGLQIELAHVVDTDLDRPRDVSLPRGLLHNDLEKVLADPEVSIVVELVGGTTIACDVVKRLLAAGKDVVTANKALLAERGEEIFAAARQAGRCVAFEASCAGGIPIVTALRTGLVANRIERLHGIVNGTCNYILTEMSEKATDYAQALADAQAAGFAEADPTLDVNGTDSAHKLAILAMLAFGEKVEFDAISIEGIDTVELADIRYGRELGYVMKLLAIAEATNGGISLRVHPAFVPEGSPLADVSGPFNAVSVLGDAVGHSLYYGRGAGMMPTASAVVADIIEVASGNGARLFAATPGLGREAPAATMCPSEELRSRYYLRLTLVDRPGVFAQVAKVLGDHGISISAVLQHESESSDAVPVVFMTARARQGDMRPALRQIEQLECSRGTPVCVQVAGQRMEKSA